MRTGRASWEDIPISEQPRDILTGVLHLKTMKPLIKPLITAFQPISTKNYAMKKPRNPLDYEVSVRAGDGNRTHISSLEGWCSTTELHLHCYVFYNSKMYITQ